MLKLPLKVRAVPRWGRRTDTRLHFSQNVCNEDLMGMESRLWNSPPSCGHRVQTKIQGLVGTPLCTPPRGSQGVVLLSSKVWNRCHGGEDLAIGIACFTIPPPLTGDQTHTHTHTHTTGGGATAAEHRAATTLQCWKRHIWLSCLFAQQAEQRQRCLCLSLGGP
jgi:hypothetical protein